MNKKKDNSSLIKSLTNSTQGYLDVFPKRDLWRQISKEFNGEFKVSHNSGNEIEILRLNIPYKNHEIVMTESDTRPLRFEIEFNNKVDYKLTVGWEDSIEKLLKKIGKREIEIGNKEFDNHYLIRSQDKDKTTKLFSQEIVDYLLKYNVYSIIYSTNSRKGISKFSSTISRTIDKKSAYQDLVNMHFRLIDKFIEINVIE